MKDKGLTQIILEFFIGVLLVIPLIAIKSDKTLWIVIGRLLYSFGIMLAMTKLMSIVYRMVSKLLMGLMLPYQNSYWILYAIFLCLGAGIWNLYPSYFSKGYFWAEIVAYALFAFWFLLDVHTTKCFTNIIFLEAVLDLEISEHKKYVDTYKNDMSRISARKDTLVEELEQYFPKKFLKDPLKELKRDPDLTRIDKYLQRVPFFQGAYKGIDGFLYGQENVNKFINAVEYYLGNLADDEQWMDNEIQVYGDYILEMEKIASLIKKSGKKVETLSELGFDTKQFQEILKGDIADAKNNRKNIKQFWKMNKKINKMRRRNYGR